MAVGGRLDHCLHISEVSTHQALWAALLSGLNLSGLH